MGLPSPPGTLFPGVPIFPQDPKTPRMGSSARRKSCCLLWLLRLLQPDQEATKPWCCWALLKGLLLAQLRRFPVAGVAM